MTYFLPRVLPTKIKASSIDFQPKCFTTLPPECLSDSKLSKLIGVMPSIVTLTHELAKLTPVFTQKSLVVIAIIRTKSYNKKTCKSIHFHFNYDTLFYGHLSRMNFFGVFYDRATQSVGIELTSTDALQWVCKNLHKYFQVYINLSTHDYQYSEDRPILRDSFVPIFNAMPAVSIWMAHLNTLIKALDRNINEVSKIEIHNGDKFQVMPNNFLLICQIDTLLIKVFDKKGWYRYLRIDLKDDKNSQIYFGVKNKDITKTISQYMDTCHYHGVTPFSVVER